MITQIIFLVVHSVISISALNYYRNTPADVDRAAKLIVHPNFLLADVYQPLPAAIKDKYDRVLSDIQGAPLQSIPSLYPFLGTVPCATCPFMYPVLTTSYKSFFSTFSQRTVEMKNSNNINKTAVQDLFYAADYVIEQISPMLMTSSYQYMDFSLAIYLVSMLILCIAIYLGSKGVNAEI
jgi:hypothetical protein